LTAEQSAFPSTRSALSDERRLLFFSSERVWPDRHLLSLLYGTVPEWKWDGSEGYRTRVREVIRIVVEPPYSCRRKRSPSHAVPGAPTGETPMIERDWHACSSDLQKQGTLPRVSDATFPSEILNRAWHLGLTMPFYPAKFYEQNLLDVRSW
jgi:hypothetical protein